MTDRQISTTTVTASLLWALGMALIVLDILTSRDTGELGLYATCAGGVLNIRGFFCSLHQRETNAFEIGRDYERGASGVRRMR